MILLILPKLRSNIWFFCLSFLWLIVHYHYFSGIEYLIKPVHKEDGKMIIRYWDQLESKLWKQPTLKTLQRMKEGLVIKLFQKINFLIPQFLFLNNYDIWVNKIKNG